MVFTHAPIDNVLHILREFEGDPELAARQETTKVKKWWSSTGPEIGVTMLALCRGIAEAHGGALKIESEVGRGAMVTVNLLKP